MFNAHAANREQRFWTVGELIRKNNNFEMLETVELCDDLVLDEPVAAAEESPDDSHEEARDDTHEQRPAKKKRVCIVDMSYSETIVVDEQFTIKQIPRVKKSNISPEAHKHNVKLFDMYEKQLANMGLTEQYKAKANPHPIRKVYQTPNTVLTISLNRKTTENYKNELCDWTHGECIMMKSVIDRH